ncbi:MAG: hypothetical protein RIQ56_437, partial [Candidatus Parcubacteria bacterium]
ATVVRSISVARILLIPFGALSGVFAFIDSTIPHHFPVVQRFWS